MTCPNCHINLECPCKHCQVRRLRRGEIATLLWEWTDGETMRCPACGFTAHADAWEDYEFTKYDEYLELVERAKLYPLVKK